MSVRCPQTNLQIRIIKKKSLRGRKDFQCRYVYQYQTKKYLLLISFLPFYFIPFHCSKSDAKVSRKRDAKQSLSIGKNKTTKMRYIDMYNTYI